MDTEKDIGQEIYERMSEPGMTFAVVGAEFGLSADAARGRSRRYQGKHNLPLPSEKQAEIIKSIRGGMDSKPRNDNGDLWERALAKQERAERVIEWKRQRRVIFDSGPVVGIFMADMHLGNSGTDYRSLGMDLTTIDSLSNSGVTVFVVSVGDLLDNFIVGRLRDLRMNQSPFLAAEEWELVEYVLERLSPYLVGSVAGNHDNWSWSLVGVDLLREQHERLNPGIMYDPLELSFILQVGDFECRVMCRHVWRGTSMYNPTHGLEHAHHTRGREFDIGVAAHTHRGGLAREFANGKSSPGHALICGSYKKNDTYAMTMGFPPALDTSAVAVVVDEDGIAFSTSRLDTICRYVTEKNPGG
jgi:hypothetical protein